MSAERRGFHSLIDFDCLSCPMLKLHSPAWSRIQKAACRVIRRRRGKPGGHQPAGRPKSAGAHSEGDGTYLKASCRASDHKEACCRMKTEGVAQARLRPNTFAGSMLASGHQGQTDKKYQQYELLTTAGFSPPGIAK